MKKVIDNKGFMAIEILVALSIIVGSLLVAMAVAQKSIHISRQALHTTQAGFLLEEGVEAVRSLRDDDWNHISSLTAGSVYYPVFTGSDWTLSDDENFVGIFTRTVMVENVSREETTEDIDPTGVDDPGTKLVTVTVSWLEGGSMISKSVSFYLANIFF